MKKTLQLVLALLLIFSFVITVQASASVPEAVMDATGSVVRILSEGYQGSGTGSGFVIQNVPGEVLVATNDHVVSGSPYSISIWVDDEDMVEAEIVFTVPEKDLCVLKVTDRMDMKALTLSKTDPQQGEAIFAVGFPGVADILSDTDAHTSDEATITDGIISAIRSYTIEDSDSPVKLLQINAAINPGNSGGPLFNTAGEVIGVNTYKVNADSQGVFGAIHISELWALLEEHEIELAAAELAAEAVEQEEYVPLEQPKTVAIVRIGCLVMAVLLLAGIVMVLLKGKKKKLFTLQEIVEQNPEGLKESDAVALLMPVAVALRDLHNNGKPHLQLSPENIRVSAARVSFKEATDQETHRFNTGFAAPEIYQGSRIGIASDIYSFAAILYYVLMGEMPAHSLHRAELSENLASLERKSPELGGLVRHCLAEIPQDRPQSMQELIYQMSAYNMGAFRLPAEAAETKKGKLVPVIAMAAAMVAFVAAALIFPGMMEKKNTYDYAVSLAEAGKYDHAVLTFEALGDYRDSAEKIAETKFDKATALLEAEEYDAAAAIFSKLDGYSNSEEQLQLIRSEKAYVEALSLLEEEDYEAAYHALEALGNHRDAADYLSRFEIKKMKLSEVSVYKDEEEWTDTFEYDNGRLSKHICEYTKNANGSFYGYSLSASSIAPGEKTATVSAVYSYDDENDAKKMKLFGTKKNLLETRIYEYDEDGKLLRESIDLKNNSTYSKDTTYIYKYDSEGRTIERQWFQNLTGSGTPYHRYTYEYDSHDTVIKQTYKYNWWFKSNDSSGTYLYENEYDAQGRLIKHISKQKSSLSYEYEYDDEDRMTVKREVRNDKKNGYKAGKLEREIQYEYNELGNVIRETQYYPQSGNSRVKTFTYGDIYSFA